MSEELWSNVDEYLVSLLTPPDASLDEALAESDRAGLPKIAVAPNQGKMLELLAMTRGARRILEIGTLGGYSTIWLARSLPPDGTLITLELESKHADVAEHNLRRAGLGPLVEVRVGPAVDSLRDLVEEKVEPFDFIFIDADKEGYPDYFRWALRLAHSGTLIVADNVVRSGEIVNPRSTDRNVLGVRRFLELVSDEERVEATAVQTVGSKGHDGFALILVR